ncbi:MAG: dihydroorotase [Paludibacter sp.]|jgi:dihydroorotase|nr:dihydroorotase [Paludibacter sp.]
MLLIKNATLINEDRIYRASVVVDGQLIKEICEGNEVPSVHCDEVTDAEGLWLLPGVIDDQVHFREPGLTHKADLHTESRAAAAGGVTSFMEMPNTMPLTITIEALEDKYRLGAEKSVVNYSFYMGATNSNLDEIRKVNPEEVCGVKVFMGSSTGNMLVDNLETLSGIFSEVPMLIATHCEDEDTIRANKEHYKSLHGDDLPIQFHPLIRNDEACYRSSSFAVELARKYNSRLHVLHLSSAREMELFSNSIPLKEKRITAEVCVHHLWFSDEDYAQYGNRIKWNPSIKSKADREALLQALNDDRLDVVATDHAPHLLREKEGNCLKAASGGPLVQYSLVAMLEHALQGKLSVEKVVRKMCHAPAELFRVRRRGFIRPDYFADLVLVDPSAEWKVNTSEIESKCGWSPFEDTTFHHRVLKTWVNGELVYSDGNVNDAVRGQRLLFDPF